MTTAKPMNKVREILRLQRLGVSQRRIAETCHCSRNTVQEVVTRSNVVGLSWPLPDDCDDTYLAARLYPDKNSEVIFRPSQKMEPDYTYIHAELVRKGVTMTLLWSEYATACQVADQDFLRYSQFCQKYRDYAQVTKATMHIEHKPGDTCSVDWAGTTLNVIDRYSGEVLQAYLFVGTLDCSKYTFAEAFPSQKIESWIAAHIHMFEYFGGVPETLVPDNCKTATIKASNYDPILNKSYAELAEHYNCAIIPARMRKPKDKPSVEKAVGIATTWIIAALRSQIFFSFTELNQAIKEKLEAFNNKPFQKLAGNRRSAFLGEETTALQPLPQTPFEMAFWKTATVSFNYHIEIDKSYYSVPYQYIKYKMDVRLTQKAIEVFYANRRLCSHPRHFGKPGHYSTNPDHMPPNHREYLAWNAGRFLNWADRIGVNTKVIVQQILASRKVEQQAYKSCFGLLKLADQYSAVRLEKACERAVYLQSPSYSTVRNVLKSGQDKNPVQKENPHLSIPPKDPVHRNIRGKGYYLQQALEMETRQLTLDSIDDDGGDRKC